MLRRARPTFLPARWRPGIIRRSLVLRAGPFLIPEPGFEGLGFQRCTRDQAAVKVIEGVVEFLVVLHAVDFDLEGAVWPVCGDVDIRTEGAINCSTQKRKKTFDSYPKCEASCRILPSVAASLLVSLATGSRA